MRSNHLQEDIQDITFRSIWLLLSAKTCHWSSISHPHWDGILLATAAWLEADQWTERHSTSAPGWPQGGYPSLLTPSASFRAVFEGWKSDLLPNTKANLPPVLYLMMQLQTCNRVWTSSLQPVAFARITHFNGSRMLKFWRNKGLKTSILNYKGNEASIEKTHPVPPTWKSNITSEKTSDIRSIRKAGVQPAV